MADWKILYEKWDQVPEELRKKIFEAFKKKTAEQLKFLFLRDTYAKLIWMKIPEAERFPPAKVLTDQDVYQTLPPAEEEPISFETLREWLKKEQFDVYSLEGEKKLRNILASLEKEGSIFQPRPGFYKWTQEATREIPKEAKVKVKVEEGTNVGEFFVRLLYNNFEAAFSMSLSPMALKEYLEKKEDTINFREQFRLQEFSAAQIETELKKLPAPFSSGEDVTVFWTSEDVEFTTTKAREWWDAYNKVYSRAELEAFDLERLRMIAKLKGVKIGKTKEEVIGNILAEVAEAYVPPTPVPGARIEYVKVRFLRDMPAIIGANMKVYGPFTKGDVVELPKVNADIIVKQEIATYMIALPELPAKEIDALRTVVKVKADDLGLAWTDEVWSRFWKEYEARARELWATKHVTYVEEEVENVLRAVAKPITPPAIRRERIRRPPTVPVEAPAEVFVEPVPIPKVPISKLPFPRAPSTEEQAVLWDAFRYEMARLGQDPFRWRENFTMHVLNRPYPDWATVTKNFSDFIEAIATGKPFRLLPLVTLPMPWREEEEQRKYDAILHFIATKLYPSMDDLLHALYTYGMEVTEDDVKKAVKKGYTEKNIWLTSVSKEMLEALIAEKIG